MSGTGAPARARVLEVVRLAYGLAQLTAPRRLAGLVGARPSDRAVAVVRVLGARHVLQALALLAARRPAAHRLGAVVDALHAASLPGLGALASDDEDARLALLDVPVASGFAVAERSVSR